MTRKRNATPCPRCKLIRQEWRRGQYHVHAVSQHGVEEMCWHCFRLAQHDDFIAFDAAVAREKFKLNEMWPLEEVP